jgi:hypothetical protein
MTTKKADDLLQRLWSAASVAQKLTRVLMKHVNSILLFSILAISAAVFSGLTLLKGGLYLGKHESDILHLLDILHRMHLGAQIHVDFQTPLGIFAFAPIHWISSLGFELGASFAAAQAVLALALLPALYWIGVTRLGSVSAVFFGVSVLAIVTAMVDGQIDPSSSISVHYNRWAWALAFTALGISVLKPRQTAPLFEGVMVGLCMAGLALLKVTYFAGFAIPVIVGLLAYGNGRALVVSVATGGLVAAVVTLGMGMDFWSAYLGDLLRVAESTNRPYPGASLADLVGSHRFLAISVVAFMACVVLRQSRQGKAALLLFLCVPGFYYVTFQNFGNDPLWLVFVVVFLMAHRPERDSRNGLGWEIRGTAALIAGAAMAIVAPIYLNILTSTLRHFVVDTAQYAPFLPEVASDIQTANLRSKTVTAIVRVGADDPALAPYVEAIPDEVTRLAGVEFRECQLKIGTVSMMQGIGADVAKIVPAEGGRLYVLDVTSAYWIPAKMAAVEGSAPWYYGGLPGFAAAEYLLVPQCPSVLSLRNAMIKETKAREGVTLSLMKETDLYAFYRINR